MALNRGSIHDRELHKFVESPTRTGEPAIEVVVSSLPVVAVNTLQQILNAQDRVQQITYADFGNKNQRVTQINYSAASVGVQIAQKIFSYSLVGNRYRRDTITWNIV